MTTIFEHNGKELYNDEGDAYGIRPESIETIRRHFAEFDKTLLTATYTVQQPKEGSEEPVKVIFAKKTGTKGAGPVLWEWRVSGRLGYCDCDTWFLEIDKLKFEAESESQAADVAKDALLGEAGLRDTGVVWIEGPTVEKLREVSVHTIIKRLGLDVVRGSELVEDD